MEQLKTALIGLGRIGWFFHLPKLIEHPGFTLVAAVDTNEERLGELFAEKGVKGYTDIQKMLDTERPQLVVIASPTHLHKEHAIAAMESGADVFLDKPAAKNIEEVREIQAAAQRLGRKIMVYQPHRTLPPVNTLKRILDTGVLGDIFMIKRATSTYMRRNDWQALRAYGGGMLNNYGAHYIDQMRYLTGEKLTEVACRCHKIASLGDADDVVKIILKTESGITVDVDINEATAYEITPWMVMGQYGTVICYQERDADPYQFHVKYVDPGDLVPLTLETGLAAPNRRYSNEGKIPWKEEVYEVKQEDAIEFYQKCYEYFALNQEAFVPFEQTVDLMEIIDRCHKLAQF